MAEKKVINKQTALMARGLFVLAATQYAKCRDAEKQLSDLLGYDDFYCGALSDSIYSESPDFDRAMKAEDFVVEETEGAP